MAKPTNVERVPVVVEAIRLWLLIPGNHGRLVTARDLFFELIALPELYDSSHSGGKLFPPSSKNMTAVLWQNRPALRDAVGLVYVAPGQCNYRIMGSQG